MANRQSRQWLEQISDAPAGQRLEMCQERLSRDPRCPVARYLFACAEFEHGRPATAVRSMMIAHHSDPALESAALLAFAGLNWIERRDQPLLVVLVDTWEEFRRPEFDRTPSERRLLNAFAAPADGLNGISPLARKLWRLPLTVVRSQLREVATRHTALEYPLLLAPA